MATPVYECRLVGMDGTVATTFGTTMIAEEVTWTLNEQDQAEVSFPKGAFDQAEIDVLVTDGNVRELQIWDTEHNRLLAWGPIINATGSSTDGSVHLHIEGVDWYLFRRFLDGTMRQFAVNEDFEDDWTGWLDQDGDDPFTGSGWTTVTDRVFRGERAARLDSLGGTPFLADNFVQQDLGEVTAGPIGLLVVASAWYFTPSAFGTYEAALEGRGLYLEARDTDNNFVANDYYPIDSATPTDKWVKAGGQGQEVGIQIPPDTTYHFYLRVYAGAGGTIYWDDIKVREYDSMSYVALTEDINSAADVAELMAYVVEQIQRPALGKSDVNIDTDPVPIGRDVFKVWQFFEHVQFDQALEEYVNTDNGIDYVIAYDGDAGTRTFTNFNHKRGTDRSDDVTLRFLMYEPQVCNISDYRFTKDGANCITRQSFLGEDNGPNREESEQTSAGLLDGLVLQDVRQAPQGTEVRQIDGLMRARLELFRRVPVGLEVDIVPEVSVDAADLGFQGANDLVGILAPGDLVHCRIADGWFQRNENLRIHQMRLNCLTNVLTLTLVVDTLDEVL